MSSAERTERASDPDATDPLAVLRAGGSLTAADRIRAALTRVPPDARPWAMVLAAVCLVAAACGAWWVVAGTSGSGPGGASAADPLAELPYAGTSVPGTGVAVSSSPELVVHAAGAVARPGLYRVAGGSRVGDVLDAAGGPTPDADPDRVNLAAPVADGARVYVPRVGEQDVPDVSAGADPSAVVGDGGDPEPPSLDLNRATAAELEELPGVGPSIAAAIVDHRQRHGPYRSVDDLLDVRGIGDARLAQLRDLVRV